MVDSDFLGVTAARLTYESGGNTVDLVWQPWFTPSRTPLLNQRWTALPPEASRGIAVVDAGARLSGRIAVWRALESHRVGLRVFAVFFRRVSESAVVRRSASIR